MAEYWLPLLIVAVVGALLWETIRFGKRAAAKGKHIYGLGEVVYQDMPDAGGFSTVVPLLVGGVPAEMTFTGKPDFILRDSDGKLLVVELKSGARPSAMEPGQRHQLLGYFLLAEQEYGVPPRGGYLYYLDEPALTKTHYLENTPAGRSELTAVLTAMADSLASDAEPPAQPGGYCQQCGEQARCAGGRRRPS